jgi:hypothetical protein
MNWRKMKERLRVDQKEWKKFYMETHKWEERTAILKSCNSDFKGNDSKYCK